jgi:hypothetical protein
MLAPITTPIADKGNQGAIQMWPSEELASRLYDLANWGLIAGLVIGVVSTIFLVWMGNAKESHLQRRLADTNAIAALANERAAEANQKAEEERLARVKIEERMGGWTLEKDAQSRITDKLKPFPDTPFDLKVDPNEARFMGVIDHILLEAKWVRKEHEPWGEPKRPGYQESPILIHDKAAMCAASGMHVEVAVEKMDDFGPAANAFMNALRGEGIPVAGKSYKEGTINPNGIHITIGKRE